MDANLQKLGAEMAMMLLAGAYRAVPCILAEIDRIQQPMPESDRLIKKGEMTELVAKLKDELSKEQEQIDHVMIHLIELSGESPIKAVH